MPTCDALGAGILIDPVYPIIVLIVIGGREHWRCPRSRRHCHSRRYFAGGRPCLLRCKEGRPQ
jgi:hypothetical protein